MTKYLKFIFLIFIVIFSFIYTNRVVEYSRLNNTILTSIEEYARKNNKYCIEGKINEIGITLGFTGKIIDENKSYSNMKGNVFNEKLLEYKSDKCILNKEDNLDKYIIAGNEIENNISIVIDIVNNQYYKEMISIFDKYNIEYNLLVNDSYEDVYTNNLLYKGTNVKEFNKKYQNIYCVEYKTKIINTCESNDINTIKIINYIEDNLYSNTKKLLNKGNILFIKESIKNLNELEVTINYIKSRGYNIVSIDNLLS